jgi:putative transposase
MTAAQNETPDLDLRSACRALGVSRATIYGRRARLVRPEMSSPPKPHPRALNPDQHIEVLNTLNSDRFCDQAPRQVYASLLDEGSYLCSVSTMYRVLGAHQLVRERRDQLRHPVYSPPQLLATGPNQVWSWDITKLLGPMKWSYFYLYVVLDIFSRYVVGWMLAERESSALASQLIERTAIIHNIQPGQLTLHADRGSSMRSTLVAQLLGELGVTKTHSRPHVSNDNPFSESQFKTLKYRPEFPQRFGCFQDAHQFCRTFFDWYNREHHHSGIGLHTPEDVHYGRAHRISQARRAVLLNAFAAHRERFVNGIPKPPALPEAVWINPPKLISRPEPVLPVPLITLGHTTFSTQLCVSNH